MCYVAGAPRRREELHGAGRVPSRRLPGAERAREGVTLFVSAWRQRGRRARDGLVAKALWFGAIALR